MLWRPFVGKNYASLSLSWSWSWSCFHQAPRTVSGFLISLPYVFTYPKLPYPNTGILFLIIEATLIYIISPHFVHPTSSPSYLPVLCSIQGFVCSLALFLYISLLNDTCPFLSYFTLHSFLWFYQDTANGKLLFFLIAE